MNDMDAIACMGGYCKRRESCARYHADFPARSRPGERLCSKGGTEMWLQLGASSPAPARVAPVAPVRPVSAERVGAARVESVVTNAPPQRAIVIASNPNKPKVFNEILQEVERPRPGVLVHRCL
jgi:hypothetical protein